MFYFDDGDNTAGQRINMLTLNYIKLHDISRVFTAVGPIGKLTEAVIQWDVT